MMAYGMFTEPYGGIQNFDNPYVGIWKIYGASQWHTENLWHFKGHTESFWSHSERFRILMEPYSGIQNVYRFTLSHMGLLWRHSEPYRILMVPY
jgi:hypothetical protein